MRHATDGALPLPLAGEGWGGGLSTARTPKRKSPHPALRADLPRKRERLHRVCRSILQFKRRRLTPPPRKPDPAPGSACSHVVPGPGS
ncbi:hypothetical protein XH86_22965 [Bradyrhizobium guangdongense]|uniref:Uncharacterized protein n=1 Tax=Bradyrhizobium guangdongense TaxID=1325090 RepID=A0ABX6UKG6_9BRAD|nr:hypothetical protein X265_22940 [Bradyrhizobium guangdongense]QOZ61274.1 hypothetical protein XH86_22965 [Bradyrhizobium guangdongense]